MTTIPTITIGTVNDWIWLDSPGWSNNPNGKNYLAKCSPNQNAPGGIDRVFQKKAKGTKGFVLRDLAAGDVIEIGATDVDKKGSVKKIRIHAVVHIVTKNTLAYRIYDTAEEAFAAAPDFVSALPTNSGPVVTLHRQLQQNLEQQKVLKLQELELRSQIVACLATENAEADDRMGGTVADLDEMVKQASEDVGIDPAVAIKVAQRETGLPLHRIGYVEPPPPQEADDEEEGLSPAQLALLKKIGS